MSKKSRRKTFLIAVFTILLFLIPWHLIEDGKNKHPNFIHPALLGEVAHFINTYSSVGIATSEDSDLGDLSAPLNATLTYEQVDSITRLAVTRAGGLADLIQSQDWVVVKPNIVTYYGRGGWIKGQNTDLRVVKSIIQQLLEEGDAAHITIAEGGVWRILSDPQSQDTTDGWTVHWPHYGNLSYEDIIAEFSSLYPDITLDYEDLNYYDYTENVPVPGGGFALDSYSIPNTILNCDRIISVAAMKTHHRTGATLTHKNYVGIAPASVYGGGGWSHWGVPHDKIERVICDLFSYHPADLGVIEGFWGTEGYGPQWGDPIKRNTILAGRDPVAVDAIGAYVMGFNPWDIDHLQWSHNKGYGINDLNFINVNGPELNNIRYDFVKAKHDDPRANFNLDFYWGRGNRTWLINGKYDGTDLDQDYLGGQEPVISPDEGDVTSGRIWTRYTEVDDYIDLKNYWNNDAANCITYAFTKIISDSAKTAYLRFGSDDGIQIRFNGEVVYLKPNTGSFYLVENVNLDSLLSGIYGIPVNFVEGENRLLVKVKNSWGNYGFSMAVCEPDGDTPLWIKYHIDEPAFSVSIDHQDGWNIIGLPVEVDEPSYQIIYPSSTEGTLYGFNGIYFNEEELIPGIGYWLLFSEAGSNLLSGSPVNELTISLMEGWNLISGISTSISVNAIVDPGGIIVPGTIYGFGNFYESALEIAPGKGYWIYAFTDGEITLTSRITARTKPSFINRLENANTISFNDVTLYFGVEIPEEEKLSYSLPPKPIRAYPDNNLSAGGDRIGGSFDVRFAGDWKYVKDAGKIEVMNNAETLTIAYNVVIKAGEHLQWVLTSASGDVYVLEESGEIVLNRAVDQFTLEKQPIIPDSYALYQNYPNPFNNHTTVHYELPEQSQVILTVYDLIGRKVKQLVNNIQEPGHKSVIWDATNTFGKPVGAGVYIYHLQAREFTQTRKMVLLK